MVMWDVRLREKWGLENVVQFVFPVLVSEIYIVDFLGDERGRGEDKKRHFRSVKKLLSTTILNPTF